MAKHGMSMPGGGRAAQALPDVYTALFFVATLLLAAAATVLYLNGSKLSPTGQPWSIQSDRIEFAD